MVTHLKQAVLCLSLAFSAATMLTLSSCQKDDSEDIYIEEGEGLTDPVEASDEIILLPSAIIGQLPDYIRTALNTRFTNAVGEISNDLDVVVISHDQIFTNTDKLLEVYNAGGTIVVVNPDDVQLHAWSNENGVLYAGDADHDNGEDDHLLYAFNRNANYYFLDDFIHEDTEENCNVLLDSFVGWINEYAKKGNTSYSPGADQTNYNIKDIFAAQTIHHTYQMCLKDKTLAHVVSSKADKLTRYGTIDVAYSVYPLYSFEANGSSAGDYYIVEGTFTVHNDQMYNGKWTKKHGGVKSHLCGFYLKQFEISNVLYTSGGAAVDGVKFPSSGSPVPETTIGATSYTSGFEWGLGGSVTGGYQGGGMGSATINANVSWNNSETRSVSDLTINKNCPEGKVGYVLEINNTPHIKSGYKHLDVPTIASNDCTIHQSWIWYVPSTSDNDTSEFKMSVHVQPTYESYHWYSSGADFATSSWGDAVPEKDMTFLVKLLRPDRTPRGTLELVNTKAGQGYMTGIQIWKEKSSTSADPDYTIPGSFYGKAATLELPVGKYKVQVKLGASADSLKTYHSSSPIEITLAETSSVDAGFSFKEGKL